MNDSDQDESIRPDFGALIREAKTEIAEEKKKIIESAPESEASRREAARWKLFASIGAALGISLLIYAIIAQTPESNMNSARVTELACVAQAAPPTDPPYVVVTPANIEAQAKPGQIVGFTLALSNHSPQALSFRITAEDMEGAGAEVGPGEPRPGIAASVLFSKPALLVMPGETASVDATMFLPADSPAHSVLISWNGLDKIRAWAGQIVQASPKTMITFVQPSGPGEADASSPQRSSMSGATVCQWRP